MKTVTEIFEIFAGERPYMIKATSYFNGREKLRFRVTVNNSPVCVFGWDEDLDRLAIMQDSRNPFIHPAAELAIARKLESIYTKKLAA
ncbi:MAG TPA: hypothetical protein VFV68_10795 [Agriterribacter sp.]|nr:hypothetical protein [Agriterribacter sp.]